MAPRRAWMAQRTAVRLLLLLLGAALLCVYPAAAEDAPPCAITPGASAIPSGMSAEQWRDILRESLSDDPAAVVPEVCIPPPSAADYAISDPIPQVDVGRLAYTARDWSRWDSFDRDEDWLCVPTRFGANENEGSRVWGVGNGRTDLQARTIQTSAVPLSMRAAASTVGKPLTADTYLRGYRATLEQVYYPRGYTWFRGFQRNAKLDWIETFKSTGRIDMTGALMNASYALSENYNIFRKTRKAAIQKRIVGQLRASGVDPATRPVDELVDAEFDALKINWLVDMPRNQATMDWYERYLEVVMSKQQLTVGKVMVPRGGGSYDAYGLFEGMDGPGYNQGLLFFYAADWAYLGGHYLKLMRTEMIRKMRTSTYASLAAQYASYQYRIAVEDRLSNQWIFRVTGFTQAAYLIIRSESILKSRGAWQASDSPGTTDWVRGKVTNADLLAHTEAFLDAYVARLERWGLTESLSTYYGFVFDILTQSLLHAPSQKVYNALEKVWKIYWFDLASNWMPSSAAFAGPSGRHYDVTTGVHAKHDYWDTRLYLSMLHLPTCAVSLSRDSWDGSVQTEVYNMCTELSVPINDLTVEGNDFNMARIQHAASQAAGLGYMPFDAFLNISLGAPSRTLVALTTDQKGQERHNWLTPNIQMGFGAEEAWGTGTENTIVAKLGGKPRPGTPPAKIKAIAASRLHSYLRLMPEMSDDPFHRASAFGVVSHEEPMLGRFVSTQAQGFMLTTSLLAGRSTEKGADLPKPWNTDLILPITVDGLWADDRALPIADGTVIALPLNTVLTVRHGDASIVLRVLRLDVSASSGIKHATAFTPLNKAAYATGTGRQEYSMTWQVDASSILAGAGRVTLHHKHRDDRTPAAWRVVVLWGSGKTASDAEMWALQRSVRHATFVESVTPSGGWDASDQPWSGAPRRAWDGSSALGSAEWNVRAQVGSLIDLQVVRTDVYQPQGNNGAYKHRTAPLNVAPYYLSKIERKANGQDIFARFYNNYAFTSSSWRGQAMQVEPASALLQPYLTEPVVCRPGVDFPCPQWRPADWTACSKSCRTGLQTRAIRCVDASAGDKAMADALCPSARPATQQECNTGPCPPGPPSIQRVQALDGFVNVWFTAPADDGGSAIQRYVALTSPAGAATTALQSPVRVGPLTNGQAYTIVVAAVSGYGTGPSSAPSASVTPDVYRWLYSDWGGCSLPCNGGTQTRTVSCRGATVGAVGAALCATPAPTDLSQSCNEQKCAWSAAPWLGCSAVCSGGVQTREVSCTTGVLPATAATTVDASLCPAASTPPSSEACNTQACAWLTGEWSPCDKICGGGTQQRSVVCTDGRGNEQAASTCTGSVGAGPASSQPCATQECVANQWVVGAWDACDAACGGGTQRRSVTCQSGTGATLGADACPAASRPVETQECNKGACVWREGTWSEGPFGSCSARCGGGLRTRTVECTDANGAAVAAELCTSTPGPVSQEACNTAACLWSVSPFSSCSVECSNREGVQTRSVSCTDGGGAMVDSALCSGTAMPATQQGCVGSASCIRAPSQPVLLSITPGDQLVVVAFEPSADTGGEAPGYTVRVLSDTPVAEAFVDLDGMGGDGSAAGGGGTPTTLPEELTMVATASPITVRGLVNGVAYQFVVLAANSAGSSTPTAPSEPIRPFAKAAAPRLVSVTTLDGDLLVAFEGGALSSAQPAPLFTAETIPAGATVSGAESPLLLTGLSPDTNYTVVLFAVNGAGESERISSERAYRPVADQSQAGGGGVVAPGGGAGAGDVDVGTDAGVDAGGGSGTSAGVIAAAVIVPLFALGALLAGLFLWRRHKAREAESEEYKLGRSREASAKNPPHRDEENVGSRLPSRRPSHIGIDIGRPMPPPLPDVGMAASPSEQPQAAEARGLLSSPSAPADGGGAGPSPDAPASSHGGGWSHAPAPYHLRNVAAIPVLPPTFSPVPHLSPVAPSMSPSPSPSPSPPPASAPLMAPYVRPFYAHHHMETQQQTRQP